MKPLAGTDSAAAADPRGGAALAMVLMVMLVVSLMGIGMIHLSAQNAVETAKAVSAYQAFWGAEAGLEHAKAIAYKRRNVLLDPDAFPSGTPHTYVGQTAHATFTARVDTIIGSPTPSYHIESEAVSRGGVTKVVEADILQLAAISIGVFGDQSLELKPNITIYSYHSSDGILDPVPSDSTGEASAGSNGSVTLSANPNFLLDGTLQLGSDPLESDFADVNCTGSNCDTYEAAAEEIGYVDPDPLGLNGDGYLAEQMQYAASFNDNSSSTSIVSGVLSVTGNDTTNTITGGTYYLSSALIGGHATLIVDVTSPVTFYVTGDFTAESHSIIQTVNGGPDRFRIYANGYDPENATKPSISIESQGDFGGFIYAPGRYVLMKPGGDFLGAVWASSTEMFPSGSVYIDMDLFEYGAFGTYRLDVSNWRETPRG